MSNKKIENKGAKKTKKGKNEKSEIINRVKNSTCILFDLDGTLIDSIPLIRSSFRHSSRQVLGKCLPDEVLMANVGRPLEIQMEIISKEKARELAEVYRKHNRAHHDELIKPYPGAKVLLNKLKERGKKIGVVTSKSNLLAKRGLEICSLIEFIDCLIAADDIEEPKPSAQPVKRCIEKLSGSKEKAIFIGDSPYDIISGKKAGIPTIAVSFGPFSKQQLMEAEPDILLESMGDLENLLL